MAHLTPENFQEHQIKNIEKMKQDYMEISDFTNWILTH